MSLPIELCSQGHPTFLSVKLFAFTITNINLNGNSSITINSSRSHKNCWITYVFWQSQIL